MGYLAAASVFVMAGTLSAQRMAVQDLSARLRASVTREALDFVRGGGIGLVSTPPARLDLAPPGPNDARDLAHNVMPPVQQKLVTPRLDEATVMPLIIAPDLPSDVTDAPAKMPAPEARVPETRMATAAPMKNKPAPDAPILEPPAPVESGLTPAQRIAVTSRLKENLSAEMLQNFSLFLYVSKSSNGPLAQRLYVFRKNAAGEPELAYDWAASTGREQAEITPLGRHSFTGTPRGYYEFDPERMFAQYHSISWDQPMPHAMFFNWQNHGTQTGLAIHAATGPDIAKLGSRASAGCVHLSPEHARTLYDLIRADYRGPVPRFAYDAATDSTSNKGALMRDRAGHLKMADGYQALIFIEDFGGKNVVAALD